MVHESSGRAVKSVRTAVRILDVLQTHDGATVPELERQLDLAKSTVHNYLGTLQSAGYVVEREGRYDLGLRLLTHGMAAKSRLPLREVVARQLSEVATAVSQPAWWVVEEYGRGLFVGRSLGDGGESIYGRVGKRSYLHTHAPGKAILATLSEEYVREIVDYHGLAVHTSETVTDLDELWADLDAVREQGYAVSEGEAALGVRSVGVAFEGPGGYVHALGVFGYSHDFGAAPEQEVPSVLGDAVDRIEAATAGEGE